MKTSVSGKEYNMTTNIDLKITALEMAIFAAVVAASVVTISHERNAHLEAEAKLDAYVQQELGNFEKYKQACYEMLEEI